MEFFQSKVGTCDKCNRDWTVICEYCGAKLCVKHNQTHECDTPKQPQNIMSIRDTWVK